MVWLKGCKRYGGDLYLDKDDFGSSVLCFQCGSNHADFDAEIPEEVIVETITRIEMSVAAINR